MPLPRTYTAMLTADVSSFCGVGEATARGWIDSGRLGPALITPRGVRVVLAENVERYAEEHGIEIRRRDPSVPQRPTRAQGGKKTGPAPQEAPQVDMFTPKAEESASPEPAKVRTSRRKKAQPVDVVEEQVGEHPAPPPEDA